MWADIQIAIAKEFHPRRSAGREIIKSKEPAPAAIASTIRDQGGVSSCRLPVENVQLPRVAPATVAPSLIIVLFSAEVKK